jgi:asparagine synthase (glutamine-hydrolysing)
MCGILAVFSNKYFSDENALKALEVLNTRGPDNTGIWRSDNVYLGHKRLSILDLDERASQPMQSNCRRYHIVFNGEIYNYQELKNDLIKKGFEFKTTSDTEVILKLFELHKEEMLKMLFGMFALVIWDNVNKIAFAARDPYGIKPLYFSQNSNGIILSSQIKSIVASNFEDYSFNKDAELNYLIFGSVYEPITIYSNIFHLESGNYLWIKDNKIINKVMWMDISDSWIRANQFNEILSYDQVQKLVKEYVLNSIKRHIVSDVPIGIFLSGGIDSSVLAAMLSELKIKNIYGITIAYDEFLDTNHDEAPLASIVAKKYEIKHYVRRVTKNEFLNDLPLILKSMDQPSIDGINTWYASKAAAELKLKVILSGVGGDELFMGYDTFYSIPSVVKKYKTLTTIKILSKLFNFIFEILSNLKKDLRLLFADFFLLSITGTWILRRSSRDVLTIKNFLDLNNNKDLRILYKKIYKELKTNYFLEPTLEIARLESIYYLRNQLLRDSDWSSMFHSIELRTPFVDSKLLLDLEPLLSNFKYHKNKILLANLPTIKLPSEIINRKKTGFAIPINKWLLDVTDKNWKNFILEKYKNENVK